MEGTNINNQLFTSNKHSCTCVHLTVEFTIPARVLRIISIVCTFSSVDSHFASTGELGRKKTNGRKIANVTTAQMICNHFHEAMVPTSTPALSSLISLYATMVRRTLARLPAVHQRSCTQGLFWGGKKAWWRMAVEGTTCDSV